MTLCVSQNHLRGEKKGGNICLLTPLPTDRNLAAVVNSPTRPCYTWVYADWVARGLPQNSARNAQGRKGEIHGEMLSGCA